MRSHEEDVAEEIIEAFLRALWSFRLELTFVAIGAGLWLLIRHSIGDTEAWIADAVAAGWCWPCLPFEGSWGADFAIHECDDSGLGRYALPASPRSRTACQQCVG